MKSKKKFERPLRIGTLFSGIGAFEQALKQMGIEHEIVFACDNGEIELIPLDPNDKKAYLRLTKKKRGERSEKEEHQFKKLEQEIAKRNSEFLAAVRGMKTIAEKESYVKSLYEKYVGLRENLVRKSYLANYSMRQEDFHQDVRFMDGRDYAGKVDILVGGSPCQSFSTYGLKRGLEDARGTLFYDYARLIKEVQPKVFIYENVRGLLMHDKGNTWKIIKGVFDSLDYDIGEPQVLNAQDYGLPQMRKRLFVVGIKRSLKVAPFKYPQKVPLIHKATDYLTPSDEVPIEYYLPEKGYKWTTEIERSQNKARMNRDIIGCQTAVQQFNWSGDFRMEVAQQRHRKAPGVYVTKYAGPDERLRKEFGSRDVVVRKLMPEECLRLMGFRDFKIVVDDNTAWRQAGNSIAVPVLKALTKAILEQVFQQKGSSK